MSILGGFGALVYISTTKTGAATNIGVATRINPVFEPNNLDIRGTGRRGLYDILLGMAEPQFSFDLAPTDKSFITTYQHGQAPIPFLHLKTGALGLTFTNAYVNTISVEVRAGEAVGATLELWAELGEALAAASWGSEETTPYQWWKSVLGIDVVSPETEWWEWRYEISNNLQRLSSVLTRATRSIEARHRGVTGLIVKDLRSYAEFLALMNVAGADPGKFNITITLDGSDLLNSLCRWGRIEAPAGPEDLIAKRFPFTALDYQ